MMFEQGWHSVGACGHRNGIGGILRCDHCRDGLVPWTNVPEAVKEVNRRGVHRLLKELGITLQDATVECDRLRGLLCRALYALAAGGTLEQHAEAAAIRAAAGWGSAAEQEADREH